MNKLLLSTLVTAALSSNAFAAPIDFYSGFVKLASVDVVGAGFGGATGHKAGNMEVAVQGGFPVPYGVTCDNTYVTTRWWEDKDRAMLSLVREAIARGLYVELHITNDPELTAFKGRCSLLAVGLKGQ